VAGDNNSCCSGGASGDAPSDAIHEMVPQAYASLGVATQEPNGARSQTSPGLCSGGSNGPLITHSLSLRSPRANAASYQRTALNQNQDRAGNPYVNRA
jgi:hypothetical protein